MKNYPWQWPALFMALLILTACAPPTPQVQSNGKGELDIEISGFRNNQGQAVIYLYPSAKGFPEDAAPELRKYSVKIVAQRAHLQIPDLPYHGYALAVLHDENRNGQMDKNLLGFPLEGFGFSRNPAPLFGPPAFSEARFFMLGPRQTQQIGIQYPKARKLRPDKAGGARKSLTQEIYSAP